MTKHLLKLGGRSASLLGLAGLMLLGCGKSNSSLEQSGVQAFQTADAPTKAVWDGALSALKTNGYVPALISLQDLATQPNLSPEQSKAVNDLRAALNDQLVNAASKGDAKAVDALKELRSSFRR